MQRRDVIYKTKDKEKKRRKEKKENKDKLKEKRMGLIIYSIGAFAQPAVYASKSIGLRHEKQRFTI